MVIQLFNNTALIRLLYTAVLLYIIYLPVVHARLGGLVDGSGTYNRVT